MQLNKHDWRSVVKRRPHLTFGWRLSPSTFASRFAGVGPNCSSAQTFWRTMLPKPAGAISSGDQQRRDAHSPAGDVCMCEMGVRCVHV